MTTQPIHPAATPRLMRYDELLVERTLTGRRLMDAFCHGLLDSPASRTLWGQLARLDIALSASPDYAEDFINIVVESEQDRWHAPGDTPTGQAIDPCIWCRLRDTARSAVVVPPSHGWSS